MSRPASAWSWRMWIAAAMALSVAIRLPMAWSPLGPDEGGYLTVARGWARGATLYRDVWVDRPQGLLVLFRLWDWMSAGHAQSVRLMAILFGAALIVATAVIVRALAGVAASGWAALLCAIVTSTPVLEGYAANGELLAGAVSATAIALAVTAAERNRSLRSWFGVGLAAGIAISLKQSGFDGFAVVSCWLLVHGIRHGADRPASWRRLAAVTAGTCVPIGILVVHAAATGWGRWWWAVVGYRLHTQSAVTSADWGNLARTAPMVGLALGLVLAGALGGVKLIATGSNRHRHNVAGGSMMLIVWPVLAMAAIVLGGGFWRHYWVQLGAPASALAGIAIARTRRVAPFLVALLVAPTLAVTGWVFAGPRAMWMVRAADDWRAPLNDQVAHWFRAHDQPHPSLFVLCASAGLYAQADAVPHYPYLWYVEVVHAPHALPLLVRYLDDPVNGPEFVAQYQRPNQCDGTGRVATAIGGNFHAVGRVRSVTILRRNLAPTGIPNPEPEAGRVR